MEKRKLFGFITLFSLLTFSVVPLFFAAAQACDPDALSPVSYGERGSAVKNAQACLIEAGYNITAGATGYYGSQTRAAVRQFYADWYGSWNGNRLGPRGVAELKKLVAASESTSTAQSQSAQIPSIGDNQFLNQALSLITQGKISDAVSLLMTYLVGQQSQSQQQSESQQQSGSQQQSESQQQSGSQPQPTQAVEGELTVEKDSSVPSGQQLREGETGNLIGIRLTAQNGPVTVHRVRFDWNTTNPAAPFRVLSKLELVSGNGDVLWSSNVDSDAPFSRDLSGNYYLVVTGLSYRVDKDHTKTLVLRGTGVNTYPSVAANQSFSITVPENGVRGRDDVGIDKYGPTSGNSFSNSYLTTAATVGYPVYSLADNNPREQYVTADDVQNGRVTSDIPLLRFTVKAKNGNINIKEIGVTKSGNASTAVWYLKVAGSKRGNPSGTSNITFSQVNYQLVKDQQVDVEVGVSLVTNVTTTVATASVAFTTTTYENALGDVTSASVTGVTGNTMHFFTVAPSFAKESITFSVTRDQNNTTSTVQQARFEVKVTANGGPVYIPVSNAAVIRIEPSSGSVATTSVSVTEVRTLGGTVVNDDSTKYTIPEGSTYIVVLQTSGQTFAGAPSLRSKLESMTWGNVAASPNAYTSSFIVNDPQFWSGWQ